MARVSVFLIMVALIAGMVGCGGVEYDLTIASTAGGLVTTPGEGTFTYDEGEVVNLVAEAEACYHFVNWTGDVSTVADVNDVTTTITMNSDYSITANFWEEEAVTFLDPNLEALVRGAIVKPTGPICPSDLGGLAVLNATAEDINDLTGLEYCTNLTELWLEWNQISDISPLANLARLAHLEIGFNQISDISPLANLTRLTELDLGVNQISDISVLVAFTSLVHLDLEWNQIADTSPLGNLISLAHLDIDGNQISDISPLANLTNLEELEMRWNQVSDISPLENLTSLAYFNPSSNQISDISPLVQNEGLGTGDRVQLSGNPLSSESINIYIPALEARGVIVDY